MGDLRNTGTRIRDLLLGTATSALRQPRGNHTSQDHAHSQRQCSRWIQRTNQKQRPHRQHSRNRTGDHRFHNDIAHCINISRHTRHQITTGHRRHRRNISPRQPVIHVRAQRSHPRQRHLVRRKPLQVAEQPTGHPKGTHRHRRHRQHHDRGHLRGTSNQPCRHRPQRNGTTQRHHTGRHRFDHSPRRYIKQTKSNPQVTHRANALTNTT